MIGGRSRATGGGSLSAGFSGGLSGGLSAWKPDLPASNKHLLHVPVITLRNKHKYLKFGGKQGPVPPFRSTTSFPIAWSSENVRASLLD